MTIQHNLNLIRKVLSSTIAQSYSIATKLKTVLPSIIIKIRVSQEIISNDHTSISTQVKQKRIQKIYFFLPEFAFTNIPDLQYLFILYLMLTILQLKISVPKNTQKNSYILDIC